MLGDYRERGDWFCLGGGKGFIGEVVVEGVLNEVWEWRIF